ncbi:MAG: ERF family protein [Methanobrevibacter sp.]|nr:ERF family protein [Methanobrevibacter sp.]MBO7712807.1 ERF family protein [Methanobrevibacter sp.]
MKSTIAKKTEGYGYKYTELADINKYCEDNGIRYYQEVETSEINQKDYIITYIEKGDKVEKHRGCQIVEAVLQGIKNPVQEYGSSLTYCRRYSLLMALGLATEDDDGASLTVKKEATKEDADKWSFTFGKYKGKTMNEVIQEDSNYMKWFLDTKASEYDIKCYELLTGEKLPTEEESKQRLELMAKLNELVEETECDYEALKRHYKVSSNNEMTIAQLQEAISTLEKRL